MGITHLGSLLLGQYGNPGTTCFLKLRFSTNLSNGFSRTKDIEKEIASLRKLIDGGANHETLEKKISEVADGSESDNEVLSRSKRSVLKDLEKCPENPPGNIIFY